MTSSPSSEHRASYLLVLLNPMPCVWSQCVKTRSAPAEGKEPPAAECPPRSGSCHTPGAAGSTRARTDRQCERTAGGPDSRGKTGGRKGTPQQGTHANRKARRRNAGQQEEGGRKERQEEGFILSVVPALNFPSPSIRSRKRPLCWPSNFRRLIPVLPRSRQSFLPSFLPSLPPSSLPPFLCSAVPLCLCS